MVEVRRKLLEYENLSSFQREAWTSLPFSKCIKKVKKQPQIKEKDYSTDGIYPIVSQESELVSGFTNDETFVYRHEKPVIIFGDHTRVIKYIDFDFAIGADGTHILSPIDDIHPKFFYYSLLSLRVKSLGYARHFKILKASTIYFPAYKEQEFIVKKLDIAFAKIDLMKENAISQLNEALFLYRSALREEMSVNDWDTDTIGNICSKIGAGATPKGGKKVYISEGCSLIRSLNVHHGFFKYDDLAHINDSAADALKGVTIQENDVLFNITGASIARCCVVPSDVLPARVNQHVCILRVSKSVSPEFLCYQLNSIQHQKTLLSIGEAGSTRQAITKGDMEKHIISFPSPNEQTRIVYRLNALTEKIATMQDNLNNIYAECEYLKYSILRDIYN